MIACYISYGQDIDFYLQSAYSILTLLNEPWIEKIVVVTQQPENYTFLEGRVEVVPVSSQELKDMSGPDAYHFRIKTLGFAKAMEANPGHDYLCLDGDTFRAGPIGAAKTSLQKRNFGLHENFGRMALATDTPNKKLYSLLKGRTIVGYTVDETTRRHNAGVMTVPAEFAREAMDKIVRATDELYTITGGYWASEEMACNFALASMGQVDDISEGIGHYWGNKGQWGAMLQNFFVRHRLLDSSLDTMIADAAAFDFTSIPVFIHPPKRRRQLLWLADKYWPLRRPRYYPNTVEQWK